MTKDIKTLHGQPIEELTTQDYLNVVSMAGLPTPKPEPEGFAGARVIAHQEEQVQMLLDLCLRQSQQLRDELDYAQERGEDRPDLEALLFDSEHVLAVQEAV